MKTRHAESLARVNAWLDTVLAQPPEQLVAAMESTLKALDDWCRVNFPEPVRRLIARDVLHDAMMRFPLLASAADPPDEQASLGELLARAVGDVQQQREAARFIVTGYLNAAAPLTPLDPSVALPIRTPPADQQRREKSA